MSQVCYLTSVAGPARSLKSIKPSGIRRFFALARNTSNCINLGVGKPEFSLPEHALK
jgi:aspartate/methionine/tyrosine aminotransferase